MRDRSPFRDEPGNWSDAFNRIPMESPERDAWSRLALEVRPSANRRKHLVRWATAAAVAALAITLPLAWLAGDPDPEVPVMATHAPVHEANDKAAPEAVDVQPAHAVDASPAASANVVPPDRQKPVHTPLTAGESDPHPPARQVDAIAHEDADALPKPISVAADGVAGQDSIAYLYAESARLEAMLARLRDDRVSSGPAAALAAQYESRLATIDASLADPDTPDDLRTTLWSERVDALHALVGFEATQRWLNARGERYDGQLVAVY
jgi:hypothetical protein